MIYFEDEKEEKEKSDKFVKNILGEEKSIYSDYVKINILNILSINDITEEMKSLLKKVHICQMFEVIATTESMGIICKRKIILDFDTFVKFIKNDFYYNEFLDGVEDKKAIEEFYKKENN